MGVLLIFFVYFYTAGLNRPEYTNKQQYMNSSHVQFPTTKVIGAKQFGLQLFNKPITVNAFKDLLVVLEKNSSERLQLISSNDGSVVRYIGQGELAIPRCVTMGQDGDIYVCDSQQKVKVFSLDGELLKEIHVPFRFPLGIVHDAQNKRLLISDYKDHCIFQCCLEDNSTTVFVGTYGRKLGQFKQPLGLALDHENNLIVADQENRRIQKFRPDGTFLESIDLYHIPPIYITTRICVSFSLVLVKYQLSCGMSIRLKSSISSLELSVAETKFYNKAYKV